jgi:hypothetical protein
VLCNALTIVLQMLVLVGSMLAHSACAITLKAQQWRADMHSATVTAASPLLLAQAVGTAIALS